MKKLFSFIFWKVKDLKEWWVHRTEPRQFKEYGLELFSGIQGSGKTMSVVQRLEYYRTAYPNLFIATNFGYTHQNKSFESVDELLELCSYAKEHGFSGCVIGWDEIQNDYDNQTRAFPIAVLRTITQQRKQGIKILATSQVFTRVAKPIREQTYQVVECRTLMERWTFQRKYDAVEYSYWIDHPDLDDKVHSRQRFSFIQTDEIRSKYDSFAVINCLRKSEKKD